MANRTPDLHTAFSFAKPFDDIQEASPLPEDWYLVEIAGPPTVEDNKTLAQAKAAGIDEADAMLANEKAGKALKVSLQVVSDDPEQNRRLALRLPYPAKVDLERYNVLGQCVYDSKLERIRDFGAAFGADTSSAELVLSVGMKGYVYVQLQKIGESGEERLINSVKIFGTGSEKVFKPYNE
jgi:hypothetical protein